MNPTHLLLPGIAFLASLLPVPTLAAPDGAELYRQHCALCHGQEGGGVPPVFPPLAGSDFIVKEREKTLRAPLEGLLGKIEVNGQAYEGGMPPVTLDDAQLAAVFAHVFSSWGNHADAPTREEIAALRTKTKFPTFAALVAAIGAGPLPAAPAGWELRVGAELSFSPVRLAAHPDGGRVLLLAENGDVWICKPESAELSRLFEAAAYLDVKLGRASVLGLTVDRSGRMYVVSNQRNENASPVRNEVTVFRTAAWSKDQPWSKPQPWLRTACPFGVGPYNHGVSHIAQGPDGLLYVNSGSRTDGGEAGTLPNYATTGEDAMTACLWRLNPDDEKPVVEIFAKGLRNSFGFCWDDEGRLLATENGPDADAPEELNLIERNHHYGFPFQFSDWTAKPYPHTPDTPAGLAITKPFRNLGPDGGGSASGLSTFDPHSCPAGIVWLGVGWPAPLGGSFLAARYGSLIKVEAGFDVLQLQPDFTARTTTAKRVLAPLGRPVDLLKMSGHRLIIAEYGRGTTLAAGIGTPGRLLVLAPKPQTSLKKTTWREMEAFQLSDGRCAAVVVPKLGGRIVSYGLIGGTNFIWTGEPGAEKKPVTQSWGGDKTYIGPHTMWHFTLPRMWPPPAPDATEHTAEPLADGRLRTISPPWESYGGARITREYGFDAKGDFVITHTIGKVSGSTLIGAVWDITQTIPTPRVFVPLNAASPYADHFFLFDFAKPKTDIGARVLSPTLLQIEPITGAGFKLGAHPPQPALAAVKDGVAFVQHADPQPGQYPEGADGAGLSVEVYHHHAPGAGEYVELELLSPLHRLDEGATLTTRWNLHALPKEWDATTIERLLTKASSRP